MTTRLLWGALTLAALFLLLVGGVLAMPVSGLDSAAFDDLFRVSPGCVGRCLMGIQPNMELTDALNILQTHEWVGEITVTNAMEPDIDVRWQWTGRQPDLIDARMPGMLIAQAQYAGSNHFVVIMRVQTRLQIPDLEILLGQAPDSVAITRAYTGEIQMDASYHDPDARFRTSLSDRLTCPARLLAYVWQPSAQISQRSDDAPQGTAGRQVATRLCQGLRGG
ncbi:MAG: hypothetical protein K8J31_29695 [Anaerolineae bacterium]|nr:hypothetical protein [Anaerolineae bacterium]